MPLRRREIILIVATVLVVVANLLIFRMDSIARFVSTTSRSLPLPRSATPTPSPSESVKRQGSYVLPVYREQPSTLQVNGILEGFGYDWVSVTASNSRYLASATETSYVECRPTTVVDQGGNTIPAHTIFLDLSRYILNLKENGKTMVEKGQILLYPQAKERLAKDVNVLAVTEKAEDNTTKLILLIVYGCT